MPKKLPSSSESDQSSDMPSPRKPKKGQPVLVSKLPVAVRSSPRKGSGPKTKPVQEFHKTLKKLVPKKVVQELPATRTSPRKTSQGQILVPKYVPKDLRQIVSKKVAQKRAPFSTNKEAAGSAGFESEESSGEEYNQQVSTPAGSTAPRFSPHITSKGSSTRTERPAEHHPVEDSDSELEEERAQQFVHQKRLLLEQRLSPSKRQVYEETHHRPHFGQPSTSRDAEEAEGTARRLYVQLQTPGQAAGQEKSRRKTRPPVKRTRPYAQKALKEIRKYQRSTDLLIQKLPFSRVVRETLSRMRASQFRWQVKAIEALQESAECYLTALFEDAQLCAFHAGRVTVMVRDLQLSRRIYTRNGGF